MNTKRTIEILHKFIPAPWSGGFIEGMKPGRFKLPFIEYARAGLRAARQASFSNPTSVPDELSPGWRQLVDLLQRKKIISSGVEHEPTFADNPKIYSVAFLSDLDSIRSRGHRAPSGFSRGTSGVFEEALSKAIGELLERAPLTEYTDPILIRSSTKSLEQSGRRVLDPLSITGFIPEQADRIPGEFYNATSVLSWVRGRELISDLEVYLPAQLVFWNFCRHTEEMEPVLRQPNTNGAAGGFSFEEAAIGGMYELLQRDAFMLHWLTKTPPLKVAIDSISSSKLKELIDQVRAFAIEPTFLYITVDHALPIYACALISLENAGERPKITLGGGADRDHESAMLSALQEAITTHRWLRLKLLSVVPEYFDPKTYIPFTDPTMNQEKRLLVWSQAHMLSEFNWILKGKEVTLSKLQESQCNKTTVHEEYLRLLSFFKDKGDKYKIYAYIATNPLLRSVGYESVKIIIPDLVPLYLEEISAPLGADRLSLLAPNLPPAADRKIADLNPLPHPFP